MRYSFGYGHLIECYQINYRLPLNILNSRPDVQNEPFAKFIFGDLYLFILLLLIWSCFWLILVECSAWILFWFKIISWHWYQVVCFWESFCLIDWKSIDFTPIFIPLANFNDHNGKCLFRGEKLYVTKDKRLKTNWRKRLLWVIGLALCIAVLIVAILLASEYRIFQCSNCYLFNLLHVIIVFLFEWWLLLLNIVLCFSWHNWQWARTNWIKTI